MAEIKTNFAQLLHLLGARPRDLVEALSVDKSLVSRWCNGKQKLMPGHGWVNRVADYLLELDGRLRDPVIPEVLAAYYPGESAELTERELLIRWLCAVGHKAGEYSRERSGFAGLVQRKIENLSAAKPQPEDAPESSEPSEPPEAQNAVVYGTVGLQGCAIQFLETVTLQPEPQEMIFACPEGLEMLTRDKRFIPHFFKALMAMFEAGHRLSVVICTDYRVSDIAAFSGPWLVAHLLGYIRSYYYDDFIGFSKDKMLAVIPGKMAGRASETEDGRIYTTIRFDSKTVETTYADIRQYQAKSKQRFHYSLFEQPDGFLRSITPQADRPHYQFARLPHFCLTDRDMFRHDFSLSGDEMAFLEKDFSPLLTSPADFDEQTTVRHIFCENDIEDALLKSRHVSQELSAITGRRVVMTTPVLARRLALVKKHLTEQKNYEVCFLPDEVFQKLRMQIACWGDMAAVGWIAGGKSTACRDYTNVNALTGFCANVWEQVPGVMKRRGTAMRKLNTWLKKAAKYGYDV